MITLKEMTTKKEMKQFVQFPFSIYKNNPYWVPPIIKEELDVLNKEINPAGLISLFKTSNSSLIIGGTQ